MGVGSVVCWVGGGGYTGIGGETKLIDCKFKYEASQRILYTIKLSTLDTINYLQ